MPNIIIQIDKDGRTVQAVALQDAKISKQTIEAAVFESTGLIYEQYDVFYRDSENDLIMTVVEEDYSIAQMTLEADTIVFHIDVKQNEQIRVQKLNQVMPLLSDKKQQESELSEDVSQEEKIQQVYQSAISQKNQTQQKYKTQEHTDVQNENVPNEAVNKQQQQQLENKEQVQNRVSQIKAEIEASRQNKQQTKNQIQKSNSGDIQCEFDGLNQNQQQENQDEERLAPNNQVPQEQPKQEDKMIKCLKYLQQFQAEEVLFNKFIQKLTNILKPSCFKTHQYENVPSQPRKDDEICLLCKQKVTKTPYFINQRNQIICQTCEQNYEVTQNLVKVRNQQSKADLLAARYLTLSYSQLSKQDLLYFLKETDQQNRSKRIDELLLLKINNRTQ